LSVPNISKLTRFLATKFLQIANSLQKNLHPIDTKEWLTEHRDVVIKNIITSNRDLLSP